MAETVSWISFYGVTAEVVWMGVATLILLSLSALVSGSETSFFSLSHHDIQQLKRADDPASNRVLCVLERSGKNHTKTASQSNTKANENTVRILISAFQ